MRYKCSSYNLLPVHSSFCNLFLTLRNHSECCLINYFLCLCVGFLTHVVNMNRFDYLYQYIINSIINFWQWFFSLWNNHRTSESKDICSARNVFSILFFSTTLLFWETFPWYEGVSGDSLASNYYYHLVLVYHKEYYKITEGTQLYYYQQQHQPKCIASVIGR